jgi:hypothetical protein
MLTAFGTAFKNVDRNWDWLADGSNTSRSFLALHVPHQHTRARRVRELVLPPSLGLPPSQSRRAEGGERDIDGFSNVPRLLEQTLFALFRETQCHRSILLITLQTTLISAVSLGYGKMALYLHNNTEVPWLVCYRAKRKK